MHVGVNSDRRFGFVTGRSKTWKKEELRPSVCAGVFVTTPRPANFLANLSWTLVSPPALVLLPPPSPPPTTTPISTNNPASMAGSDELEYLKSLVAQLNDKIHVLEQKAKAAISPKTPAQQLRTILIGPPGAGEYFLIIDASQRLI